VLSTGEKNKFTCWVTKKKRFIIAPHHEDDTKKYRTTVHWYLLLKRGFKNKKKYWTWKVNANFIEPSPYNFIFYFYVLVAVDIINYCFVSLVSRYLVRSVIFIADGKWQIENGENTEFVLISGRYTIQFYKSFLVSGFSLVSVPFLGTC